MPTRPFSVDALKSHYQQSFPRSAETYESGRQYFPNGVSQVGRYYSPFPIFIESAIGPTLNTVDGRSIIDFWQGHFAN
jgi:glutamate-1-semialdehyde aminotransferase